MERTLECIHDFDVCGVLVLCGNGKMCVAVLQCCRLLSSSCSWCFTSAICVFILQACQHHVRLQMIYWQDVPLEATIDFMFVTSLGPHEEVLQLLVDLNRWYMRTLTLTSSSKE